MDKYLAQFETRMYEKYRILPQLVEDYKDTTYFLDHTNACPIKVVEIRTSWLEPIGYEIETDQPNLIIDTL